MFLFLVGVDSEMFAILLGLTLIIGLILFLVSSRMYKTIFATVSVRRIRLISWLTTIVLTPLTMALIVYGWVYLLSDK